MNLQAVSNQGGPHHHYHHHAHEAGGMSHDDRNIAHWKYVIIKSLPLTILTTAQQCRKDLQLRTNPKGFRKLNQQSPRVHTRQHLIDRSRLHKSILNVREIRRNLLPKIRQGTRLCMRSRHDHQHPRGPRNRIHRPRSQPRDGKRIQRALLHAR